MNNTSEKLIHISMRTFSEMGYYGTSLNNIANELGIKKASLYSYFKSKDELYEQCIENCMSVGLSIIEGIDSQPLNVYDELSSFFYNYIYDSDYLVKFYVQLSFAPSNFTSNIEHYNHKLSTALTYKLEKIHAHHKLKLDKSDFVLLVRMFINGWLYRRAYTQSEKTQNEVKNEFNHHANLLLSKIK